MTVLARVYSGTRWQSALERAKKIARDHSEEAQLEFPSFDGGPVSVRPDVRLYRARDGAYVVERR